MLAGTVRRSAGHNKRQDELRDVKRVTKTLRLCGISERAMRVAVVLRCKLARSVFVLFDLTAYIFVKLIIALLFILSLDNF